MTRSRPLRGPRSLLGTRLGAPGLGAIPSAWSGQSAPPLDGGPLGPPPARSPILSSGTRCTLCSGCWVSDSPELKRAARRGAPL